MDTFDCPNCGTTWADARALAIYKCEDCGQFFATTGDGESRAVPDDLAALMGEARDEPWQMDLRNPPDWMPLDWLPGPESEN